MAAPSFITSTAVVNWIDPGGLGHLRVYESDGNTVTERARDSDSWVDGGFSKPGAKVSATIWVSNGQPFIRVYCSFAGKTTEWCSDGGGDWYQGEFTS